jgi:hypothetical protein
MSVNVKKQRMVCDFRILAVLGYTLLQPDRERSALFFRILEVVSCTLLQPQ